MSLGEKGSPSDLSRSYGINSGELHAHHLPTEACWNQTTQSRPLGVRIDSAQIESQALAME